MACLSSERSYLGSIFFEMWFPCCIQVKMDFCPQPEQHTSPFGGKTFPECLDAMCALSLTWGLSSFTHT